MENEDVVRLQKELERLKELQGKFFIFVATQSVDMFAIMETVLEIQRLILAHAQQIEVEDFPEMNERLQTMLEAHRTKHAQTVQETLKYLRFLYDKPQGPVA